jgi:phosphoadenosine phosphosulfate reductase
MSLLSDVWSVSSKLSTPDLLRYAITEKFPGKTVVSSSLRARSIVALAMIADVDPATPVVFCRPGHLFPQSLKYREHIIERLGLTNVSESGGRETSIVPGDHAHCERMWSESEDTPGRTFEITYLNDSLAPYDCWISAVYHVERRERVQHRVDKDGRLIRIDPLLTWSREDVRRYMLDHKLPFHPRAGKRKKFKSWPEGIPIPSAYHF